MCNSKLQEDELVALKTVHTRDTICPSFFFFFFCASYGGFIAANLENAIPQVYTISSLSTSRRATSLLPHEPHYETVGVLARSGGLCLRTGSMLDSVASCVSRTGIHTAFSNRETLRFDIGFLRVFVSKRSIFECTLTKLTACWSPLHIFTLWLGDTLKRIFRLLHPRQKNAT